MTFSFRPRRSSRLAHDRRFGQHPGGFLEGAAEMNESVDSDALVMPSSM